MLLNIAHLVKKTGFYFGFVLLFTIVLSMAGTGARAQTKGLIVKPATGAGRAVLDPNGDGYVSRTSAGFLTNDYNSNTTLSESEIPYRPLPLPEREPMNDLARGPGGGFSDFADMNGTVYPVATYLSPANNLMFRFRLGGIAPNSKGYSILVDSDGLFGNSGSTADPHFSVDNPGFEFEILLATNFSVRVYNVNNSTGAATLLTTDATFPYEQHCQKAIAFTTNNNGGSSSANPDYFYDFYIPFGSLQTLLANAGININANTTGLRMVANTIMAPQSAIRGPISDMGGIDDTQYTNPVAAWNRVVQGFVPTTAAGTTGSEFPAVKTTAPVITSTALVTGNTTITGTSAEIAGTTITIYRNGTNVGTTMVQSGGTWSYTGPALGTNDRIVATASASGKSVSDNSNEVIVRSACTYSITPVLGTCTGSKGVDGTVAGATTGTKIRIYNLNDPVNYIGAGGGLDYTVLTGTPEASLISAANPGSAFIYKRNLNYNNCNAGASNANEEMPNGSYFVTSVQGSNCESARSALACYGTSTTAQHTVTQNTITQQTTTLSGLTGAGTGTTKVIIFVDGFYAAQTTVNAGTAWSISGLVLRSTQVLDIYAVNGTSCAAVVTRTVIDPGTPPMVNSPIRAGSGRVITGTSSDPAGTVITVFRTVGTTTTQLGTTTVGANGNWSYTVPVTLATGDIIFATATPAGKTVSASSNTVTVTAVPAAVPAVPTITLINGAAYREGGSSVQGTGPASTTINVYIDNYLIGTTTSNATGNWTLALIASNYDLYAGGRLTATSGIIDSNESTHSNQVTPVIVECNPPAIFSAAAAPGPICAGEKQLVTIANSERGTIYTIKDNSTDAGTSTLGTGSSINLYSFDLATAPLPYQKDFTVVAQSIYGLNCNTTQSTTSAVTVNPAPLTNLSVSSLSSVPSGSTTTVTVENSQAGYIYSLREGTTVVGSPASITSPGGSISFTTPEIMGTRTFNVLATDPTRSTNCTAQLTATRTISTNPLPVELISFTGKFVSNGTLLEWATATEKDNDYFQIERSQNGKEFTAIGTVRGNYNSVSINRYNFTDNNQLPGQVYYRLKQVDTDGTFAYSQVIALDRKGSRLQNQVVVYPNPAADKCNLVVTSAAAENAVLVVYDAIGNVVQRRQVKLEIGQTEIPVETISLPNGMYFISITGKSINEHARLQKTSK